MTFRNIAKYPFTALQRFTKFILNAESTKWPGLSRSGIYILITALSLSIAQIGLHLWLAVTLSNLLSEVEGCYELHGIVGLPMPREKVYRPVTYADIRGREAFSIDASPSIGTVVTATFLPFGALMLLVMAVLEHFSRKGITNRHGVLLGIILFLSYLGIFGASAFLNVDTDHVRSDYEWCWVDHAQMTTLAGARESRIRVRSAIAIIIAVESACAILYTLAAFHAARTNANNTLALDQRLHDLSPERTRIDTPTPPPRPPNAIRIGTEASNLPPLNTFEAPESVAATSSSDSAQNDDTNRTYQPSNHPVADPAHLRLRDTLVPSTMAKSPQMGHLCTEPKPSSFVSDGYSSSFAESQLPAVPDAVAVTTSDKRTRRSEDVEGESAEASARVGGDSVLHAEYRIGPIIKAKEEEISGLGTTSAVEQSVVVESACHEAFETGHVADAEGLRSGEVDEISVIKEEGSALEEGGSLFEGAEEVEGVVEDTQINDS